MKKKVRLYEPKMTLYGVMTSHRFIVGYCNLKKCYLSKRNLLNDKKKKCLNCRHFSEDLIHHPNNG